MKTIRRLLCMILVVTMLLPSVALSLSAVDDNAIVNLYDESLVGIGMAPKYTYDEQLDKSSDYYTTQVFTVREGETITVGPILENDQWFIRAYDENGKSLSKMVTYWDCAWDDAICNNAKICTYTVPAEVKYLRVMNSYTFYDCTLITKNRVFTGDEYFAYMDQKGVDVDFLRPTNDDKALVNLFPARSDETLRGYVKSGVYTGNHYYRSRTYEVGEGKDFEAGDVIYFAAAYQTHDYFIDVVNEDGTTANVQPSHLVLYEDLERGYAIYAYRVRPNAKQVSVILGTGVYDDGISLVTRNQPFTGEKYREMFEIDLDEDILDETSPLYGLTGLFMGDSISRGSHDYISYTDQSDDNNLRVSWAGGISARTGLISTNPSVSGARMGYTEGMNRGWICDQQTPYIGQNFDLVVLQGGVNDASGGRHEIGEPLPMTSSEDVLFEARDTFIGGLQYTMHMLKKNFPSSTFFYIANYQLAASPNHTTLGSYFDAAKAVCQMYGFYYIDLFNNEELNARLEHDTLNYIEDKVHPNKPGYDIITPYIQEELERVMASLGYGDETTVEQGGGTTTPEPDGSDVETNGAGDGASGDDSSDEKKGCGSVVGGATALVALTLILPAAITVRKKENEA